jgi:hypothetical protein
VSGRGTYLIRNISYELLDKTKLTTDILLRFRDIGINKKQYDFIEDRLENFNLDINSEYSIVLNSNYDESKEKLLIKLSISIPNLHKPDLKQINDYSYRFINFYEMNIKLFNSKNKGRDQ